MSLFLGAHHLASPDEADLFFYHLSIAMLFVGVAYIFYLAIEPYARRLWPRMLISWVRIMEGRFRDPLVGRDLLLGSAGGVVMAVIHHLQIWVPDVLGSTSSPPRCTGSTLESLRGTLSTMVAIADIHTQHLLEIVFPLTLLLIFRLLLRRTWAAILAITLVGAGLFFPASGSIPAYLVGFCFSDALFLFVLFRVGLLGFAAMLTIQSLLLGMPLTPQPAGWYLGGMLLALGFIVAPALYGFWTAQAGRPLFRDELLEPVAGR